MAHLPEHIVGVLRRELPDADPDTAELLGEGWNATASLLQGKSQPWVVRVPKLEWAAGEMERQTCLGAHLSTLGLPVPRDWRLFRDAHGAVVAGAYAFVAGREAPRTGGRALDVLSTDIAAFFNRLHDLDREFALRECNALLLEPWTGRYQKLIATYGPMTGPSTQSWLEDIGVRLEHACASIKERVLVHADLSPEHVVCDDDGRLAAVLDFSGPQVTDPAVDFGRLVQWWGTEFADAVLARYQRRIDDGFRERMVAYARLESLRTIEAGVLRDLPQWVTWGRRHLAAHAAAARRRGST